ncbi:hypothetical protein DI272_29730 [Streptomyces sp. Act143]|nr:hypothetical protein DI272_29730 [Streptomyces sp. Act143]
MLDAAAHHRLAQSYVEVVKVTKDDKHPLFMEAVRDLLASGAELASAILGVQLCAPAYVIDAAQKVADTVQGSGPDGVEPYKDAQVAFLNAARYDLDYNPKRWQLWKQRKTRKFTTQPRALERASEG